MILTPAQAQAQLEAEVQALIEFLKGRAIHPGLAIIALNETLAAFVAEEISGPQEFAGVKDLLALRLHEGVVKRVTLRGYKK